MAGRESDPDGDQLLLGEASSVGSGRRDDAEHWLSVYEELYGFKQKLLGMLDEQASNVKGEGRAEVDRDEKLFQREAKRLARRANFWKREVERLRA